MGFAEWAKDNGQQPGVTIGEWLQANPTQMPEITSALAAGYTWKQAAQYAMAQGSPACNEDSLRKAISRYAG